MRKKLATYKKDNVEGEKKWNERRKRRSESKMKGSYENVWKERRRRKCERGGGGGAEVKWKEYVKICERNNEKENVREEEE
jgi:hypothetical protein